MTALEKAYGRWGRPRVDMFDLKCWRLWWPEIHRHRGASSGDLSAQGQSIEECAARVLVFADSEGVYVGPRDECQQCKNSVDW